MGSLIGWMDGWMDGWWRCQERVMRYFGVDSVSDEVLLKGAKLDAVTAV